MKLQDAALVRPGNAATLERLSRIGGRIERCGETSGIASTPLPYAVVRLGRRRLLIVLSQPADPGPPA